MFCVGVAISGAFLAINGTITIGDIQAFITYVKNFTQPIAQIAQVTNMMQSMMAAAERVFEFLEEEEETRLLKILFLLKMLRELLISNTYISDTILITLL